MKVELKPRAEKDLRSLPTTEARKIAEKLKALESDLSGDVKRLTNFTPEYRLRVGNYRVLFEVEETSIVIYRIMHRQRAYSKR